MFDEGMETNPFSYLLCLGFRFENGEESLYSSHQVYSCQPVPYRSPNSVQFRADHGLMRPQLTPVGSKGKKEPTTLMHNAVPVVPSLQSQK